MSDDALRRALMRADAWRLLTLAFDRPTRATLEDLAGIATGLMAELEAPSHPLLEPLQHFREALNTLDADMLEHEYHHLFTTQMLVTPQESSYHRTGRGAVIGDVAAFYHAFGLHLRPEQGAADSMRNELAFMAWLTLKEAYAVEHRMGEAVDITHNAIRTFLADHLGRWALAFTERLFGATATPYYQEAGALLIAVLNQVTAEFAVRDVAPLDLDAVTAEPEVMSCPAAGICNSTEA